MYLRRLIIGYLSLGLTSCLGIFIFGWDFFVQIFGAILIYSVILYITHIIWTKIRGQETLPYIKYFITFLYKIGILLLIIILGGLIFSTYQNIINPAKLPYYILSNGQQKVHFQTMSHIASSHFYRNVRDDIRDAKKGGYILYYEGVRPGSHENTQKFQEALGIKIQIDTYGKLSQLYGIIAQDNQYFLSIENNRDYNVDLSIDEIMEIYNTKTTGLEPGNTSIASGDINSLVDQIVSDISPRELNFMRFVNQAFLNLIIKNEYIRNSIMRLSGNTDLFGVILDDRNIHLVSEIYKMPQENIFVIYGLMHFQGVFELLKAHDDSWEIIESGSYQVITR